MKIKIGIFASLFLLFANGVYSQKVYDIGAAYQYGLNFNNASEQQFGSTVPFGVEVNFHRQRIGNEYWEKLFNYPQTGWALSYINHQNKYLGSTIALSRSMNYVFVRKKSFETYIKISAGFLYATKIYEKNGHANDNYNNAISQNFNLSAELGAGVIVYPASKLSFKAEVAANHFSNGAMSQPNDGLNLIMFKLGAGYIIGERNKDNFIQPAEEENDKRVRYNLYIGTGFKHIDNDNEEKYRLFSMSFYADKKISHVNAFNVGVDIFMNRAVEYVIENSPIHEGKDFKRIGVSAGHEFFIYKLGIMTQFGYHVYSPYPAFSDFYQKFGLKYYFNDCYFVGLSLRVFKFEISDEITWGIGVRL